MLQKSAAARVTYLHGTCLIMQNGLPSDQQNNVSGVVPIKATVTCGYAGEVFVKIFLFMDDVLKFNPLFSTGFQRKKDANKFLAI